MPGTKIWKLWDGEKINHEEALLLRKRAEQIPVPFNKEGKRDIETLIKAFLERDDAVGLAAPQIGISKRIIAFRTRDFDAKQRCRSEEDYSVLVNPRITQFRGEKESMSEGCLSCPDINVEVSRYPEIKVRAYDVHGTKINERYTGFIARIVQHEFDHLEGNLIIDYEGTMYCPKDKQEFFKRYFSTRGVV